MKRCKRFDASDGGGAADLDYVMRWTMWAARRLTPLKTRPHGIAEDIRLLRDQSGSMTSDALYFRYAKLRWRIRTEWPADAKAFLSELDQCLDADLDASIDNTCREALFD
jgi:hypothetical protein